MLPGYFVGLVGTAHPETGGLTPTDPVAYPDAPDHYGLLWWNNADGTLPGVPLDAFWGWGDGDNLLVVVPSLDLVVARAGSGWSAEWNGDYTRLAPFLDPIARSRAANTGHQLPDWLRARPARARAARRRRAAASDSDRATRLNPLAASLPLRGLSARRRQHRTRGGAAATPHLDGRQRVERLRENLDPDRRAASDLVEDPPPAHERDRARPGQ